MKRLIYILPLLFFAQISFGQVIPQKITVLDAGGGSTDTTSLNNRINLKIDSVKTSNDSLFYWNNGTKHFGGLFVGGGSGGDVYKSDSTVIFVTPTQLNDSIKKLKDTSYLKAPLVARYDSTLGKYVQQINTDSIPVKLDYYNVFTNQLTANSLVPKSLLDSGLALKQNTLTLTTTGSSGAATLTGVTLNIPNYAGSGIDSNSVHFVGVTADSASLIFSKPNGHVDTVGISVFQYWKKNLNSIYLDSAYKVVIGGKSATSALELRSNALGVATADSSGFFITNTTPSTSSVLYQQPASFGWSGSVWNPFTSSSVTMKARIRPVIVSYVYPPYLYLEGSINGGTTYNTQYGYFSNNGFYTGTSMYGVSGYSVQNGIITNTLTSAKNIFQSYVLLGTATPDFSGILNIVSTNQGLLPPRLTTSNRDSINLVIYSITVTNPGTGYTSAPTVYLGTGATSYLSNTTAGTATANLSGTTVGSITLLNPGNYYHTANVTFSGGGGSGATAYATMRQNLTTGTTIYNTDISAIQTWNGIKWVTSGTITGTATLASGTVTVSAPSVISTSKIYVSYNTPSGTQGFLSAPSGSITSGTSFVINSSSASDNSTVNWSIIN